MSTRNHVQSNTVRAVLVLALPVLAEQFLNVGVGLVDTWLTGNYLPGDKYLAAIGQMAYLLWLIPNLFSFVAVGATALTARFVGARDFDSARHTTNQAFSLGVIMVVFMTALLLIGGDWLIDLLQLPADAGLLAKEYLRIVVPVIPAIMIEQIGIACLRGAGDTVSGLLSRALDVFGHALATFFTGGANPETSADAARLLKVAAIAMPSLAIAMIVNGALRGAGDTRWPLAINLIGMAGTRIPLAYSVIGPWQGLFAGGSLGVNDATLLGVWYAMVIDIGLRSLLVLARFFHGGWKRTRV